MTGLNPKRPGRFVQKNFKVDPKFLAAFDLFCRENGYNATTVFLAATRFFMELPVERRMEIFRALAHRKAEGQTR